MRYDAGTQTATFTPSPHWRTRRTYTATVSGAQDAAGNMMAPVTWSFTTGAPPPPPPDQGPAARSLVVDAAPANPFSTYLAEILRTEGLNEFATIDVGTLSAATLAAYDVVVLGNVAVTAAQAAMFTTWVNGGGNLIAFRPDTQPGRPARPHRRARDHADDGYLKVDTTSGAGRRHHRPTRSSSTAPPTATPSTARRAVATLYSTATTATSQPGRHAAHASAASGGQAAAFTYDLPQSVV